MSSSDHRAIARSPVARRTLARRTLLGGLGGLGVLALGGCFTPMLRQDTAAGAMRNSIALPVVDGRFEHFLVESLEDRLGEPVNPAFRLAVVSTIAEQGLAIAQDNAVTRISLIAEAAWTLTRIGTAEPLITDTVVSQAGYNATGSLFATRQTRRDVERRLARDLGERISRTIFARAEELTA